MSSPRSTESHLCGISLVLRALRFNGSGGLGFVDLDGGGGGGGLFEPSLAASDEFVNIETSDAVGDAESSLGSFVTVFWVWSLVLLTRRGIGSVGAREIRGMMANANPRLAVVGASNPEALRPFCVWESAGGACRGRFATDADRELIVGLWGGVFARDVPLTGLDVSDLLLVLGTLHQL